MSSDPVTVEVVASRLRETTATMEYALYHSGYSPVLRESKDGTSGLTDHDGRVVMIGGGLQYHFTTYEQSVRALLARYPKESLKTGESFITNDPYHCGSAHAPDFVALTPAFHNGMLIGFGVSVAHKSDIGGIVPGLVRRGSPRNLSRRFAAAARALPDRCRHRGVDRGDHRQQQPRRRYRARRPEGAGRLDAAWMPSACGAVRRVWTRGRLRGDADADQLTKRRIGDELQALPDGSAEAEGRLDHDGAARDRPLRIRVRATKSGGRLQLDFTGTDVQTAGPVNLVRATAEAAGLQAVLASIDPTISVNAGLREAVEFVLPEGSLVNARHPATVNLYFPTAHLVYNVVLSALGVCNPARAVAPSGLGSGAVTIGYRKSRSGKPAVLYELLNTSLGGTSRHDGAAIVMAMNHFTPGAPVEIFESEYPLRVRAFELVRDSAGAGKYRGGIGYAREFEVLEDSV